MASLAAAQAQAHAPASAPTPPVLAIKTANASNMAALVSASGPATPSIITSKEWIIPPRPKPGRKPANDIPQTKRKAQNRAAQRAFRERRAARVGELEEQLEETKEEQQKREAKMKDNIARLEAEVSRFSGELQSWKMRCDTLDRIADYERKEKEAALAELSYLRNGARTTGTQAVPLPPRRARHQELRAPEPQQHVSYAPETVPELHLGCGNCNSTSQCTCVEQAMAIATSGCGKCTVDTHCECLEETIKAGEGLPISADPKRSRSPSPVIQYPEKRQRHSDPSTPLEIDFTTEFSSKPTLIQAGLSPEVQMISRPPGESCGFCVEGAYCMCAEAANAAANSERDHENRLAPLLNEVTPPPSDTDADVKLPPMHPVHMHRPVDAVKKSNSCANGPGTCQQCQNDPKSGLFCRSLAALRDSSTPDTPGSIPDGCCGGNTAGGGCCKSIPAAGPSQPPPSLSCADTYKTLSTHKNFDAASDELNTWLGRLHATPPHQPGRAPMEVEAASVMGVLKLFDRRFGRG